MRVDESKSESMRLSPVWEYFVAQKVHFVNIHVGGQKMSEFHEFRGTFILQTFCALQ